MNILKKICSDIYRIFYALPFGAKAGEVLTSSNKSISIDNGTEAHHVMESNRLSDDLMKGEVTQQVEELRYRDYKVSEESRRYKYLGNGVAVKGEKLEEFNGKIKFTQINKIICEGVLDELNRVNSKVYGKDRYVLNVIYEDTRRFKLEKYCTRFTLNIKNEKADISLYFDSSPDMYDFSSKSFINELKLILEGKRNSDVTDRIKDMSFVTFNVFNEKNFILYSLYNLDFSKISYEDNNYCLKFIAETYSREDLIEKYKCDELEKKYQEFAPKEEENTVFPFGNKMTKRCSVCGKLISDNDAYISNFSIGKEMCPKCWEGYLQNQEE